MDHPAAIATEPEAIGKAEELAEPVDDDPLELGRRRRRRPQHPLDPEAGAEQFAEDRRTGGIGREVGKEPRMLPVRQPRNDDSLEIAEHRRERLRRLWRRGGKPGRDLPRLDVGKHALSRQRRPVVGDPVHDRAAFFAEPLGIERGVVLWQ